MKKLTVFTLLIVLFSSITSPTFAQDESALKFKSGSYYFTGYDSTTDTRETSETTEAVHMIYLSSEEVKLNGAQFAAKFITTSTFEEEYLSEEDSKIVTEDGLVFDVNRWSQSCVDIHDGNSVYLTISSFKQRGEDVTIFTVDFFYPDDDVSVVFFADLL